MGKGAKGRKAKRGKASSRKDQLHGSASSNAPHESEVPLQHHHDTIDSNVPQNPIPPVSLAQMAVAALHRYIAMDAEERARRGSLNNTSLQSGFATSAGASQEVPVGHDHSQPAISDRSGSVLSANAYCGDSGFFSIEPGANPQNHVYAVELAPLLEEIDGAREEPEHPISASSKSSQSTCGQDSGGTAGFCGRDGASWQPGEPLSLPSMLIPTYASSNPSHPSMWAKDETI